MNKKTIIITIGIAIFFAWILESLFFIWSLQTAGTFYFHQISIFILYILGGITILYTIVLIIYSSLQKRYKGLFIGSIIGIILGIPAGFLTVYRLAYYGEGALAFIYIVPIICSLLGLLIGYQIGKRKEFSLLPPRV